MSTQSVRAVADYRGLFMQEQRSSMFLRISNLEGAAQDPDSISVVITDQNSNLATSGIPEKAATGFYVFDWLIPQNQPLGPYTVTWSYVVGGQTQTAIQTIEVASSQTYDATSLYTPTINEFRLSLTYMLQSAQAIPVYNEQARRTSDPATFRFTFPRWNQTANCRIYVNDVLQDSGFTVNFFKGTVIFDQPLTEFDRVNADYNFRWFSDEELDRFLSNAIGQWNFFPPAERYTLNTLMYSPRGQSYIPFILYGAAIDALRQMMLALQFQQPQLIFGGPQGAEKAFSALETLKKNYEESWKLGVEQKKNGPYVGLTRTIVTPEFTLPGGRCLSAGTTMTYVYCDVLKVASLEEMFYDFKRHPNVYVPSEDDKNNIKLLAPVSNIWASGMKNVFEVTLQNQLAIKASLDHLFFVNNKYVPLKSVKIGDIMHCMDGTVTAVKKIELAGKEQTFDLEVPSTGNLFANGIKCHNSRWFRYLYSSGG